MLQGSNPIHGMASKRSRGIPEWILETWKTGRSDFNRTALKGLETDGDLPSSVHSPNVHTGQYWVETRSFFQASHVSRRDLVAEPFPFPRP